MKCKLCNISFNSIKSLISHIKLHDISSKTYYDTYIKSELDGICLKCGSDTTYINFNHGYRKYCSSKCNNTSIIKKIWLNVVY